MPKKTERKKPGPKPLEPTAKERAQVRTMVAAGIPTKDIAAVMGCSNKTLYKYYREEIRTGAAEVNGYVAGRLLESIKKGNVTAMIFWAKTRMRWREADKTENNTEATPRRERVIFEVIPKGSAEYVDKK